MVSIAARTWPTVKSLALQELSTAISCMEFELPFDILGSLGDTPAPPLSLGLLIENVPSRRPQLSPCCLRPQQLLARQLVVASLC